VLSVEECLANYKRVRVVLQFGSLLLAHGGTCSKPQLGLILLPKDCFWWRLLRRKKANSFARVHFLV